MEQTGKFNAISEKLRDSLPHLEPGQVVTYELLVSEMDHVLQRPVYGASRTLRLRDRIKDGKNQVDIGVIRSVGGERGDKIKCEKFVLNGGGENGMVGARFDLHGGNLFEEQVHQFFSICNYNSSNENADVNTPKLIRQIDASAEAKERGKKRSALRDALILHEDMKAEDVRMYAASMNWNSTDDINVLRAKLGDYAEKNPQEFISRISDPETKNRAELKVAMDKGVIAYDPGTHQMKYSDGTVIATLDRVEGKNVLEMLSEYLSTSKNGSTITAAIRKKVSAAITTALKGKVAEPVE